MNVYERLRSLRIELPGPRPPAAAYVGWVVTGSLLFLSGHTARQRGQPWVGRLGHDMDTTQGQAAARATAIDMLGSLHAALGDLDRIQRLVKLNALVSSDSGFTEHHLVANGASELFVQVLGEKGRHARSAFGVAQTPNAACLELELIAEIV